MSIVLIDLHQLNVKTTEQYKSATLNTGATSCQPKKQNPQNNNPQHPLS